MRIPTATYRIQFTPEFGFREARTLIEYLKLLGISDIYASPIFHARPGSTHGYDIVDGGSLNPELGSQDDFLALSTALKQAGMGWLQDIVPNHRAFDANNSKLNALLEGGPDSRYGDMFDIDWEHHAEGLNSKLLAPFLGRHYGVALEAGEIRLNYSEQGFFISYFDLQFPLRIESYATVLTHCVAELRCRRHEDSPGYTQLLGILYALKFLDDQKSHQKRAAEVTFIKQNLWNLYHNGGPVKKALDSSIHTINGQPGEVNSFNSLDGLLQKQWFRLAFWKVANEEINYRRFFFINDLICLRAENEETFNSTHEMPLQLYKQGHCTGFRIDHIDGLYDPHTYLQRLRQKAPKAYLIVEKILSHKEQAPAWMGQGTTGYDFLNMINGIFCHSGNEQEFTRLYHNYSRVRRSCSELLRDKKKLIIEKHMHGDLENLSHELKRIAVYSRYGSDLTLEGIRRALREVLCLFPAYRTYLSPSEERPEDRECLKKVIHQADRLNPDMANELKFIRSVLLPQAPGAVHPLRPEVGSTGPSHRSARTPHPQ